ncbi:MAG TPA: hypothetical protein VG269_20510 [Tepidisphaeraceae bacterium]|jgi:hypothetical protein|nr:hypothetical protein [Tepidisphaeraceae bacterium]
MDDAQQFAETMECWDRSRLTALSYMAHTAEGAEFVAGIGVEPAPGKFSHADAELLQVGSERDMARWWAYLEFLRDRLVSAAQSRQIKVQYLCLLHEDSPNLLHSAYAEIVSLRDAAKEELEAKSSVPDRQSSAECSPKGHAVDSQSAAECLPLPPEGDWLNPPMSLSALARIFYPQNRYDADQIKSVLVTFDLRRWPCGTRQKWTLNKAKLTQPMALQLDGYLNTRSVA